MASHSSILDWEIPWIESLVGYCPWSRKESDMTEWLSLHFPLCIFPSVCFRVLSVPLGYQGVFRVENTGSGFRMPGSILLIWSQANYIHGLSRFQLSYLQNGHISDNTVQWHYTHNCQKNRSVKWAVINLLVFVVSLDPFLLSFLLFLLPSLLNTHISSASLPFLITESLWLPFSLNIPALEQPPPHLFFIFLFFSFFLLVGG